MNNTSKTMVGTTVFEGSSPSQKKTMLPPMVFSASFWSDMFTSFTSLDKQVQDMYSEAVEELKKEVRTELMNAKLKIIDKMILIDTLERLGLSYHFEKEIEEQLKQIYGFGLNFEDEEHDLFSTALQFRLLRQHGYNVSFGVFNRFYKNNGKKFEESLCSDINGLLCLYEAASTRFHDEDVLEEALSFTVRHFKRVEGQLDSPLHEKVMRILGQYSLHRGIPRAEARRYISLYEKDKSKDELLLRLAKIDFHLLQSIHKKELYDLTRWWKTLDITTKLPYARERIVECYLWALALHFEPEYSFARLAVAKATQMASLLNDTYDNCGTLEELDMFTEILQSWDINKTDQLPDYMKVVFQTILNVYEDLDHEVSRQGRSYAVTYAKETIKQLGRGYNAEAKWFIGGKMPTFDEYTNNGVITSTYYVILSASFLGMECATQEVFEWLITGPKILVATGIMGRVMNDIASYERESRGGQVLTPVDCYMKQYGTSTEQTLEKFSEIADNAWKDVNEEWILSTASIPRHILLRVLNLARSTEANYKHGVDGYTSAEEAELKEDMFALFVDPIII